MTCIKTKDQKNVAFLKSIQGKSKGSYLTRSERAKLPRSFSKKDQLKIFRKFNLR